MIPILYAPNTKSFTTQGMGRLSDAISCIVTEERNGAFELEMEYPIDGIHWSDVDTSSIILAKPNEMDEAQPFRVYRISKPINGRCMVYAEHISYQLSYIPVLPFTNNNSTSFAGALQLLQSNAAEDVSDFTFDTNKNTTASSYSVSTPKSLRSLLGGTSGSLLDTFGTAEYKFDRYSVYAYTARGADRGVTLRYGKNITDITQEESIESTITGVFPYWADADGNVVTLTASGSTTDGTDTITWTNHAVYASTADAYPYNRTAVVDFTQSFDAEPSAADLAKAAAKYITDNEIGIPKVSITVSFIPLWQSEEYADLAALERVGLCDIVTVEFEKLGVSTTAKVVKTVYDVLKDRYESIEIGSQRATLTKQLVELESDDDLDSLQSLLEQRLEIAYNKITGVTGGYIEFLYDAQTGYPYAIRVMDDRSSPTHIMQIDHEGIGFSSDGGASFTSAWTIDGEFDAQWIVAGSLSATKISGGRLVATNGNTYFDLDSGYLNMQTGSISIGGVFSVTSAGDLTATSATITGAITATSGSIGGFTVGTSCYNPKLGNALYNGDVTSISLGAAAEINTSGIFYKAVYSNAVTRCSLEGQGLVFSWCDTTNSETAITQRTRIWFSTSGLVVSCGQGAGDGSGWSGVDVFQIEEDSNSSSGWRVWLRGDLYVMGNSSGQHGNIYCWQCNTGWYTT